MNFSPLCEWWCGGGRSPVQGNVYYSFPNTDVKDFDPASIDKNMSVYQVSSVGPAGARMEAYVSPFGITSYAIMGLGLDCSRSTIDMTYAGMINQQSYDNHIKIHTDRIMGSMNLMTMVTGKCVGYITLQGGLRSQKYKDEKGGAEYLGPENIRSFDYRLGYGLQRYFNSKLGVVVEGGYGGGAYARVGLCYWFPR